VPKQQQRRRQLGAPNLPPMSAGRARANEQLSSKRRRQVQPHPGAQLEGLALRTFLTISPPTWRKKSRWRANEICWLLFHPTCSQTFLKSSKPQYCEHQSHLSRVVDGIPCTRVIASSFCRSSLSAFIFVFDAPTLTWSGARARTHCLQEATSPAVLAAAAHSTVDQQPKLSGMATTQPAHTPALPAGWEQRISRSKGMAYYVHMETGKTTWVHPQPELQTRRPKSTSNTIPATDGQTRQESMQCILAQEDRATQHEANEARPNSSENVASAPYFTPSMFASQLALFESENGRPVSGADGKGGKGDQEDAAPSSPLQTSGKPDNDSVTDSLPPPDRELGTSKSKGRLLYYNRSCM